MRKCLSLVLAMLLAITPAFAETAKNFASKCRYSSSGGGKKEYLWDKDYSYNFFGGECVNPHLTIQTPSGRACHGLYICWNVIPEAWELKTQDENGEWYVFASGGSEGYAHVYVPVPGLTSIRLQLPGDQPARLSIKELMVLDEGELPEQVQVWQPTPEKADLLLLSAHPDDEYIFMGGTIPYYAGELGLDVAVCYMTYANPLRRSELLNGLWHAGLRTYPILLENEDRYSRSIEKAYSYWDREDVLAQVHGVINTVQPEVMVTHDIEGEYGHGAHRVCADLAMDYVQRMQADSSLWPLKKLYLHLYPENQIDMDWRVPLQNFDGRTALEVAQKAFTFHRSQVGGTVTYQGKEYEFKVRDSGYFDNSLFGLYHTSVGPDAAKNDMFENIGQ